MKKFTKTFFSLSFILLLAVSSNAQIWAPPGAKWYYSFSNFWITGYVSIEKSTDTLIYDNSGGQFRDCQKLDKTFYSYNNLNGNLDTIFLGSEYTWSNADTVFIFRHNRFYVLYDFSAQPGNTWIVPETNNLFGEICDSVGVVNVVSAGDTVINAVALRYIVVEPEDQTHWVLFGKIIEKTGPLWYMLPEQACIIDYMEGGPLRCYQDNDFQYISGIALYCDYIVGVQEPEANSLVIYPNPAKHHVTIKCKPNEQYDLEIINSYGKTIKKYHEVGNGMSINLQGIEPGLYFVSLRNIYQNIKNTKLQILRR